jgi:hypothetical protein
MKPIDEIRAYLRHRSATPRVLLICGGQFSNAVGDTVTFAYHYRFLSAAVGPVRVTVWTADTDLWTLLCGDEISCTPFFERGDVVDGHDLIIFDWVTVGDSVEALFRGSHSVLMEVGRAGAAMRYRLGSNPWRSIGLYPTANIVRRITQAYASLGVDPELASVGSACTRRTNWATRDTRVYLNPYGSNPQKCMDERVLGGIIGAMSKSFWGKNVQVSCPSMPAQLPPGDSSTFTNLAAVVTRAANAGTVCQLHPMSVSQYVKHVSEMDLVIGPDTSSQHIANYYGVPSVTCYPSSSGYRFYFWGCPGPNNLCYRTPDVYADGVLMDFGHFLSHLSECLLNASLVKDTPPMLQCDQFMNLCSALCLRSLPATEGAKAIEDCITALESLVPPKWHSFIFPELRTIAGELCERAISSVSERDEVGLERMRDIYALKTIRLITSDNSYGRIEEDGEPCLTA